MERVSLGQFYTKNPVGELLITLMGDNAPSRLVDLGSGMGSLTVAARNRWRQSNIVTVDIDKAAYPNLARHRTKGLSHRHQHVVADALDVNLPSLLPHRTFDAAVCNPPYGNLPIWRPSFARILREAGLLESFNLMGDASVETLFLAQNLRLTNEGGRIGLIVPDGLITGRKSIELRRALLTQHDIECVVQLPRGSFLKTEAQAFIVILRKGRVAPKRVNLLRFGTGGVLSRPLKISHSKAEHRLDYDFYNLVPASRSLTCLSDLGAQIARGSLQSSEVRAMAGSGLRAFHTTNFPSGQERRCLSLPKQRISQLPPSVVLAKCGDILLARVDRSLHLKVALVCSGSAPISDCVLRIRVPSPLRLAVFRALTSPFGESRLRTTARGVAARMISKEDLMQMPLELVDE